MAAHRAKIIVGVALLIPLTPLRAQHNFIDPSSPFPPVLGDNGRFRGDSCGGGDMDFGHGRHAPATRCMTRQGGCPVGVGTSVGQPCQCSQGGATALGCAQ